MADAAAAESSYIMDLAFGRPKSQGVLPSLPISTGILTALTMAPGLRQVRWFISRSWRTDGIQFGDIGSGCTTVSA
ncbi:hypothetical protein BDW42DRAFT_164399 [Aspergillus taichungensis]|uniref:Uncharacterized protein n=1 Tax=Aspergillus taichungensis TaxID=482145 RepID=A0A2J5I1H8_9EURO|nr:hypothetical protein BDW42DRAFT_164399 [Aspergillus taichungensis]